MRTWEENKTAINQLWPTVQFTDEEKRLWHEDLSSLDQDVLYDAIRNAKRTHDNPWPQLKWVLECYRDLRQARKSATARQVDRGEKLDLQIDSNESEHLANDFAALIDMSLPADFEHVQERVLEKCNSMEAVSAIRVLKYARKRLLGETEQFGRVTDDGGIEHVAFKEST
jgi:hypothetical protein